MGMHLKCDLASSCPWGSDSVPGTCGFTSCQRDKIVRSAKNGNIISTWQLKERGLYEGKMVKHPDGTVGHY